MPRRSQLVLAVLAASLAPACALLACSKPSANPPMQVAAREPAAEAPAVSVAPVPLASASQTEPLDAGAIPDCSAFAASHAQVSFPPRNVGMVNNAIADASVDRGHLELLDTVSKHVDSLRCCYDAARQRQPDLRGALVLEFDLAPDGSVTHVAHDKPRSQIVDDGLGACVAAVWQTMHFASSRQGRPTMVSLPISFQPAGEP